MSNGKWKMSFFLIHLFFKIIKHSKSLQFDSHSIVGRFDNIFFNCFATLLHYNYNITVLLYLQLIYLSKKSFKVAAVIFPSGKSSVGL